MVATSAQLQELLDYCMDFAKTMLNDAGDFYPFGAKLSLEGQVVAVGGHSGSEKPLPQDIYQLLIGAFVSEAQNGSIAGAALAANVNVPDQYESPTRDAIRVHVEAPGFARFIYVPYKVTRSGLFKKKISVTLHEPFAVEVSSGFFQKAAP